MNVFELAAEAFEWIIFSVSTCFQYFLDYNHYFVSVIIHCFKYLIHDFTSAVFDIVICLYLDFAAFIKDLNLILHFVGTIFSRFISKAIYFITNTAHYFCESVNNLYTILHALYDYLNQVLDQLLEYIPFFISVIFNAFILILQIVPNLLILLYESCINILLLANEYISYSAVLLLDSLFSLPMYFYKSLCLVPLKAYCGIILCTWMIYSKQRMFNLFKTASKYSYKKLSNLLVFVFIILCTVAYSLKSIVLPFLRELLSKVCMMRSHSLHNSVQCFSFTQSCKKIVSAFKAFKEQFHAVEASTHIEESGVSQLKKEANEEKGKSFCLICQNKERNVILLPCRHLCSCQDCTERLQSEYHRCPLCRNIILSTLLVYT